MASSVRKSRYAGYLLVIAAGILLWVVSVRHIGAARRGGPLEVVALIFGVGLVVWQILKISKSLRRDTRRYVVLKSDTGSVRVHAGTVEEALRHTAKSLPEVHDVRVRPVIDPQSSVPSAGEVDARISDITNVVTVHDALSRVLTERYEQIIPGAPPIEFHLTIKHHFRPPSKPKKKRKKDDGKTPPEEAETKSIRAPQYPVPEQE
jgi:hypothetical protein